MFCRIGNAKLELSVHIVRDDTTNKSPAFKLDERKVLTSKKVNPDLRVGNFLHYEYQSNRNHTGALPRTPRPEPI